MAKRSRARRAAGAAGRGARALGKWSVQGAKGSAAAAGAGVVAYMGLKMLSGSDKDGKPRLEIVQKHPVAAAASLIAGGHFLKRKYQSLGAGVIGAGAALTALAYDLNRANKPADTGALVNPGDIGALVNPGDIGATPELDAALADAGGVHEDSGVYDTSEVMGLST